MPRSVASSQQSRSTFASDTSSVRRVKGFKLPKYAPAAHHEHARYIPPPAPKQHVIGLTNNYDIDAHHGTVARPSTAPHHYSGTAQSAGATHLHSGSGIPHWRGGRTRELDTHVDVADYAPHSWQPREWEDEQDYEHEEMVPIKVREKHIRHTREVPVPHAVPHYIEVAKPYAVEKLVEVPTIVEKIVEVPVEVERTVEVRVPYPVEVIKTVEVPVPYERVVEKIVEVDRPVPEKYRVEVPINVERIREVKVPIIEEVAVPMPDPRLHKVIQQLQEELKHAYHEIDRKNGYNGQYSRHYNDETLARQHKSKRISTTQLGVREHPHHQSAAYALPAPPRQHRSKQPLTVNAEYGAGWEDPLAHNHPTRKWGGVHDIPGKQSFPAEPFYKHHGHYA